MYEGETVRFSIHGNGHRQGHGHGQGQGQGHGHGQQHDTGQFSVAPITWCYKASSIYQIMLQNRYHLTNGATNLQHKVEKCLRGNFLYTYIDSTIYTVLKTL